MGVNLFLGSYRMTIHIFICYCYIGAKLYFIFEKVNFLMLKFAFCFNL